MSCDAFSPSDVCLQIESSERAQGWNFSAGPGTWQLQGPSLFLLHGLLSHRKQFKGSTGVSHASRSLGTLHSHHPFLSPLFPEGEKRSLGPWEARWGIRCQTARQIHLGRTRRKGFHTQDLEAHTLSVWGQLVPSDHRGAVGQLHSAAPPDIPTSKVFLLKWKQGSSYQPLCNSEELSCLLGAPESSSWIHLLSVVPVTQLSETANNLCKSI